MRVKSIKAKKIGLNTILAFGLYLTCFFPFLKIVDFPMDVQPYAMIFAVLYCFSCRKIYLPKQIVKNLWVFMLATMCFIIAQVETGAFILDRGSPLRKYLNYISVLVITVAVYTLLKNEGINERLIKVFIGIWCAVGIIQLLIRSTFLYEFISNARTSSNRGVISLASEPSFYGYMCLFFMLIIMQFTKHKKLFITLCLFQICLLAQSGVTIIILAIWTIAWVLTYLTKLSKKKRKTVYLHIFLIIICILSIAFLGSQIFKFIKSIHLDNRVIRILQNFSIKEMVTGFFGGANSLLSDGSTAMRLNAIKVGVFGFFENFTLPHGFVYHMESKYYYPTLKIQSGYGTLLYELGFAGLWFAITIFKSQKRVFSSAFYAGAFFISMFSSIQLALPILSFWFAYGFYLESEKSKII